MEEEVDQQLLVKLLISVMEFGRFPENDTYITADSRQKTLSDGKVKQLK